MELHCNYLQLYRLDCNVFADPNLIAILIGLVDVIGIAIVTGFSAFFLMITL